MDITLCEPLDMHLHLRGEDMLKTTVPLSSKTFCGALVMPNLLPPITTLKQIVNYKKDILSYVKEDEFMPYMTLFFKEYKKEFLKKVAGEILSIKLYPAGATTNSKGGVSNFDIDRLRPTLLAMSSLGIVLCVHGESNGFVMDREKEFIPIYEKLAKEFPKLKIIMEHITTKQSVELLGKYENLFATITIHHLLITLDDVAGALLRPHLFCKPIAKRYEDREALQNIALAGNKKVMFGSDSAPHPKSAKESPGCAAGIFTAPIALQMLVEFFHKHNALDNLQQFVSDNAKHIYNINPNKKRVTLEKKEFIIPKDYDGVVPMYAGQTIGWSLSN